MYYSSRTFLLILLFVFTCQQGISQNALNFDGVDDLVNCGNDASVQITGTEITLEAWINPSSWTTEVWRGNIINKGDMGVNGYMIRTGDNGRFNFNIGNGSVWTELTTAQNVLTLNTWQHVAATYDGVKMRVYVNGLPVDSLTTAIQIGNSTIDLAIGADLAFTRYFPGSIDEVRVWDVQRTQQQIMNSMSTELCTPAGLVAYYQLNAGTAGGSNSGITTINDMSINSNTGTLTNMALTGSGSNWVSGVTLSAATNTAGVDVQTPLCDTYTWIDGITYTSNNNTATYIIPNVAGCDSLVTLNLTLGTIATSFTTDVRVVCGVLLWIDGNFYVTDNNTATYTLTNAAGCDSIITLDLTVNNHSSATDVQTACSAFTWIDGVTYTSSTNVNYIIPNASGCDSTITLDLTITTIETTDVIETCEDSYTWIDGNTYTTNNNTANMMFQTANGCDSLVTLDLSFENIDVSTSVSQVSLITANNSSPSATFQWVNCENNFEPIIAATDHTFAPAEIGSYAVVIEEGNCIDTSDCINITTLNINSTKNEEEMISVFPNPTSGKVSLNLPATIKNGTVNVIDLSGKVVQSYPITNKDNILSFQLNVAKGVYFLEVKSTNGTTVKKVVKY